MIILVLEMSVTQSMMGMKPKCMEKTSDNYKMKPKCMEKTVKHAKKQGFASIFSDP